MGLIVTFTLDLYCDHPEAQLSVCTDRPGQFSGPTKGSARAAARRAGWKFKPSHPMASETLGSPFLGACYCPVHAWDIPKIERILE